MEKAHPQVLNVLLQLLDDGRITDSQGHIVDCSNCIVIMTSNLGAEPLLHVAGQPDATAADLERARAQTLATIRNSMRPELLNRLDDVLVFNPLTAASLRRVVRLQLADVLRRLEELDVDMTITDAAVDHVLEEAHDPQFGARPLKRYMERHLVSRLSTLILEDKLTGGSIVTVDWQGRRWDFQITTKTPRDVENELIERTPSVTLGRAGSRDQHSPKILRRTDSQTNGSHS